MRRRVKYTEGHLVPSEQKKAERSVEEHFTIPFIREVVIFLVASGIVVPVFHRLRASPVLGYLIVGGLVGPTVSDFLPMISAGSLTSSLPMSRE